MRRSRESGSSVDNVLSSTELYNAQGEAVAALESLTNEAKETVAGTARSYNQLLLTHVVRQEDQQSGETFLNELDDFERSYRDRKANLSTRKRRRNAMILAYNRGLVLFTHGKAKEGVDICRESLAGFIDRQQKPSDDLAEVASRTAFLIFECLLHLSTGRQSTLEVQQNLNIPPVSKILSWLESLDTDRDPQLKFQLSLYKTRLELAEGDQSKFDARIRSSRKELKSAMEVFQHKLRPAFGADTASVVSSANSEENMSAASTTYQEHNHPHQPQQALGSIVLQRYNQAALNLKASSEAMKGNVKKSLILCSEAYGASVDNADYEAIHSNNLGLVYETNDKRHLALHVLSKGLNHSTPASFKADGSASPSQTLAILYNSALCALRAGNYISAYECMASCVARSTAFDNARCWLRMAEACLGIYHELDVATNRCRYNIIESDGYVSTVSCFASRSMSY
jgi:tetratricopeptide (TPR) repeat protein